MYPYVELAGRYISTYSVMACVGTTLAVPIFTVLLRNRCLLNLFFNGIIAAIIGLIIGGKFFGVISILLSIYQKTGVINIYSAYKTSGIVYYGGLLGFLLFYKLYCKVKGLAFECITNELAICIPLFHFWGRIGCYLTGCCYGSEYRGFFSVLYDNGKSVVRRIPTQLIEALFELCLFIILFFVYFRKRPGKSKLLIIYLGSYAVFRFLIEFLRGDSIRGVYGKLSFSQCISMIVIGYLIIYSKRRHHIKKEQTRKHG